MPERKSLASSAVIGRRESSRSAARLMAHAACSLFASLPPFVGIEKQQYLRRARYKLPPVALETSMHAASTDVS
jgi:hypothetical protein